MCMWNQILIGSVSNGVSKELRAIWVQRIVTRPGREHATHDVLGRERQRMPRTWAHPTDLVPQVLADGFVRFAVKPENLGVRRDAGRARKERGDTTRKNSPCFDLSYPGLSPGISSLLSTSVSESVQR